MFERIKGKDNFLKLMLVLISLVGIYLMVAWISYSPSDNAWTVANNLTDVTLNKTGFIGAWWIDLLYAMFGKVTFLIPCTLAFVPIYYFILGEELRWNWLKFFTRLLSFIVLMIGLAILANTLLSSTREYLSGGFIGSMLSSWIESGLGLFGALVIGMLLTIVGFYFCSAQTLLQLGSQLYQWVLAGSVKGDVAEEDVQREDSEHIKDAVEEEPAIKTDNVLEQANTTALTDVSQFTRPKIIGLGTPSEPVEPAYSTRAEFEENALSVMLPPISSAELANAQVLHTAQEEKQAVRNQTYIANETVAASETLGADIEPVRVLPTVSLATAAPTSSAPTETGIGTDEPLPQVRLTPLESGLEKSTEHTPTENQESINLPPFVQPRVQLTPAMPATMPETIAEDALSDEDYEAELARQFTEQEEARIREMEARAKQQGLDQTFQQIMETPKVVPTTDMPTPTVAMPHMANTAPQKVEESSSKTNYPKGYGETLIHPLLQQPTRLEKPTTPLPTLDLLKEPAKQTQQITEKEILEISQHLEQELANFGVKATVEDVLVGPVVTRYEIQPAPGTKAAKIMSLGPDLARALMFDAIRITDKVPNKPYMGIETPNAHRQIVWLREVFDSDAFRHTKAILPMALGKDISGNPVVIDMAKTPHLLVAGQTGSGKSVGVNTMILSLLYKLTPEQVRFIMIDPKVVELAIYDNIPHLLTPVVTDMKQAANALNWAVEEMERRYALLRVLQVRNIEGYNSKIDLAAEMKQPIPNPLWRPGDSMDSLPPPLEKLSYIVLIVDEFADLLMTEGKKVEEHIQRITQKARAVGIHLILATQRPSTDVITGVIKANIPSRIAFTVATQIDSRTILERGGAESLLNRGDMLYSDASSPDVIRVHGAYMSDEDVQRVADDWRARGKPKYIESIIQSNDPNDDGSVGGARGGELDPLFDEVVAYVIESNVTSISGIQRRFSLGFNRAAKIIDQMEIEGIISAPDSRSKREVLAR